MYKLLLVSDQEDVLRAFDQVPNWEYNGFRKPHIRHDVEGAKESLKIHHADGIAVALAPAAEEEMMAYLQACAPLLPIFEAGRSPEEVQVYLAELNALLNRIRADFSSDAYDEQKMMIRARRHFFRKLVDGRKMTCRELYRGLRLRRSRMDPDYPCMLMRLQAENRQEGTWQDVDHLLELGLFRSFGGDVEGYHVLPLVTQEGKIYVLAGPLRGQREETRDMEAMLESCVREGIRHAEEYQDIQLRITGIEKLPSLYALCVDYQE
ncbi:MAG: hypothetical protein IJ231_05330 [Clostridia bacterium]|nr:hypothetical protein [Clostridia bacterium]